MVSNSSSNSSSNNNNSSRKRSPAAASQPSSKRRREVVVVTCPSDFPTLTSGMPSRKRDNNPRPAALGREKFLDWDETAREIHKLGATAFEGKQKRDYKDEEYERLTGRKKKHHQVPLPIVRAIAKKAAEREKKRLDEAREAGLVIPSAAGKKKKGRDRSSDIYGPAPSIGFLKNGVLKVKDKKNMDRK